LWTLSSCHRAYGWLSPSLSPLPLKQSQPGPDSENLGEHHWSCEHRAYSPPRRQTEGDRCPNGTSLARVNQSLPCLPQGAVSEMVAVRPGSPSLCRITLQPPASLPSGPLEDLGSENSASMSPVFWGFQPVMGPCRRLQCKWRGETDFLPHVVVHTWNPSTQKAEAGRSRVPGQPGLHSETVTETNTQHSLRPPL
jgi:hypothetical protein